MSCEWEKLPEDKERCTCCGLTLVAPVHPIHHACKSRGLGDTVAKAIRKVASVFGKQPEPCDECKERQEKLNKLVPYK